MEPVRQQLIVDGMIRKGMLVWIRADGHAQPVTESHSTPGRDLWEALYDTKPGHVGTFVRHGAKAS